MTCEWNPRKPDVERFTEGDCHYLARAIHKLTGWPMMAFDLTGDPDGDVHAFIHTPDCRFLDIEGAHDEATFFEQWSSFFPEKPYMSVSEYTWDNFKNWGTPEFGHYSYRRAREMARRILEHFYPEALHGNH